MDLRTPARVSHDMGTHSGDGRGLGSISWTGPRGSWRLWSPTSIRTAGTRRGSWQAWPRWNAALGSTSSGSSALWLKTRWSRLAPRS